MPTYLCAGVVVQFPFPAYACQVAYMSKVIIALDSGTNALLESPTGTGKTLCLLCAVLAWREVYASRVKEKACENKAASGDSENYHAWTDKSLKQDLTSAVPRIIYTSRTHSQLQQVTRELKKTAYRPSATVVGGREQLCVHAKVSKAKGAKQTAMCASVCANSRNAKKDKQQNGGSSSSASGSTCPFYMSVFTRRYKQLLPDTSLLDIEELSSLCKDNWVCPFWKTREDAKDAALVMCPYNYVIDPVARKALGLNLRNCVVIFDEGHNIESVCEGVAGFELSLEDLDFSIAEVEDAASLLEDGKCEHVVGGTNLEGEPVSSSNSPKLSVEDLKSLLALVKSKLLSLQEALDADDLVVASNSNALGDGGRERVMLGCDVFQIFTTAGLTGVEYNAMKMGLSQAISCLAADTGTGAMSSLSSSGKHLEKLQKIMTTLFENLSGGMTEACKEENLESPSQLIDENFKVLIQEQLPVEEDSEKNSVFKKPRIVTSGWGTGENNVPLLKRARSRTLCFWCFTSKPAMLDLRAQGVRSLLITSGTLSPMDSTRAALGVPFPVTLENAHVVAQERVCGCVLSNGPGGEKLSSTFANRGNLNYVMDLGRTLCRMIEKVPDGMLVAFASYAQMEAVLKVWRGGNVGKDSKIGNKFSSKPNVRRTREEEEDFFFGTDLDGKQQISSCASPEAIFSQLEKHKKIFVEPVKSADLKPIWKEYCEACVLKKGALLFAIARGKLTEGVDFSDRQCRAVFVCGLPFPPLHDPKVRLKKQFLVERKLYDPDEWYSQQAARAVNQTVGRVIRHRLDFGAVVLCDWRFGKEGFKESLSKWLRPSLNVFEKFGGAYLSIGKFFKKMASDTELLQTGGTSLMAKEYNADTAGQGAAGQHIGLCEANVSEPQKPPARASCEKETELVVDSEEALRSSKPLTKVGWMELCEKLVSKADFLELTETWVLQLRANLGKIQKVFSAEDCAQVDTLAEYREAVIEIRNILLPAVTADSEKQTLERKKLVSDFLMFLHPKFREYWREKVRDWAVKKRLGKWAETIFPQTLTSTKPNTA